MKRFWIWMIPILAAISAIWIQAALHGYDQTLPVLTLSLDHPTTDLDENLSNSCEFLDGHPAGEHRARRTAGDQQ